MKILYIHQYFTPPKGVGGLRSYQMAKKLIEKGHAVTMVCLQKKNGESGLNQEFIKGKRIGVVDGIRVIEFKLEYSNYQSLLNRSLVFLKFAFRSIKIVFTEKYDIIFTTSTPLTAGIPGIIAKLFRRKKFIFEVRDLWPELPKAMGVVTNPIVLFGLGVLEWLSYHFADKIIALAPGIKTGIEKRGIPENRIELIPNGCDLDLFHNIKAPKKFDNSIGEHDFIAAFTGAHGKANGLHVLLDVAQEINKRKIDNIKILLVGDGKVKPELIKSAKHLKLENIIFMSPIPKMEIPKLLNKVDVGLMILDNIPAFYNGTSPNKFFDYISAGLPIINNYPGWLANLITENNCGFAVEPNNIGDFVDKLVVLQKDNILVNKIRNNSRNLAEREFNRDNQADKFVNCLESVVYN